jgi:hypothetical protein
LLTDLQVVKLKPSHRRVAPTIYADNLNLIGGERKLFDRGGDIRVINFIILLIIIIIILLL